MIRLPGTRRNALAKTLLVFGGLLTGLLLVEVILWTCDPFDYTEIEDRDLLASNILSVDVGRPRLIPGVRAEYRDKLFAINSEGLRNREVLREKPPSTFRIMVLGGSVPFGWGVRESECFPRLIETRLNEDRGRSATSVEVVNAAVPGYGLHQQLQQIEEIGHRYSPDMVIVPVMWGNVPSHSSRSSRFLSPGFRKNIRTLRLVEILFMKLMGDDSGNPYWRPSDLDPRGVKAVSFGLGLFKQVCDRLGTRMIVLDALGIDSLVGTCARLGVFRMPFQTDLQWLKRHRISDRDAHPDEKGHLRIAKCVVRQLRLEIPR